MSDELHKLHKLQQDRIKQLFDLGLKFNGDSFIYEGDGIYINFHHTDLLSFGEEKWNKEYNGAVEAMKKQPKQSQSKITRIYGASDDLIEIDGAVEDEVNCYKVAGKGIKFTVSDGTIGTIKFDGQWRITVKSGGTLSKEHVQAKEDEDDPHTADAIDCPSYSDVLIFNPGVEWVTIGKKTFKAS